MIKPLKLELISGGFTLVDAEDYEYLQQFRWRRSSYGYATRAVWNGKNNDVIYLHRELLSPVAGMTVDHINGYKLDNRRSNLRVCTLAQNLLNRGVRKDSHTGMKGVGLMQGKYRARINGRFLGYFNNPTEAHKAYVTAALVEHGEFARAA